MLRIKNWKKFQHFKDRSPPWVKLYRDLMDDPDWHDLSGDDAKTLTMLWMMASEDETHSGLLPAAKKMAFRMRVKEIALNQTLTRLSHWLIQDDIGVISGRYQVDAPETETETETETDSLSTSQAKLDVRFESFWTAYPKKIGKGAAEKAFIKAKINGSFDLLLSAIEVQKQSEQWQRDGGQFIPFPATWLNQKRWEDETSTSTSLFGREG